MNYASYHIIKADTYFGGRHPRYREGLLPHLVEVADLALVSKRDWIAENTTGEWNLMFANAEALRTDYKLAVFGFELEEDAVAFSAWIGS